MDPEPAGRENAGTLHGCDGCGRMVPRDALHGNPDQYLGCGRCTIRCPGCYWRDAQCETCRAEADAEEADGCAIGAAME